MTSPIVHLQIEGEANILKAVSFYQMAFDASVVRFEEDLSVQLKVFSADVFINKDAESESMRQAILYCPDIEALIAKSVRAEALSVGRTLDGVYNHVYQVVDPVGKFWHFSETVPHTTELKLRPSEYGVILLMLLCNKYVWKLWREKVTPKLDSALTDVVVPKWMGSKLSDLKSSFKLILDSELGLDSDS